MSINFVNVETKLKAIRDKNLSKIIEDKIAIPSLGTDYTYSSLETWINKRILVLENIQTLTTTDQVQAIITPFYNKLCSKCKAIVDSGEIHMGDVDEIDYDRMVAIVLYRFALSKS